MLTGSDRDRIRIFATSCLVVAALASPARAESNRAFFRVSPGLTVASIHRVFNFDGNEPPATPVHTEERIDTTGVGGQLEIAGGARLGDAVQLGGVLRYAMVPNVDDVRFNPTGRFDYLTVGPQLTVFATRHLYARGELALGHISQYRLGVSGVAIGAELGYAVVVDGRSVQAGLAASRVTAHHEEAGDPGDVYNDRFRVVTVSAVLSMTLGRLRNY
jgi:hypothetical protein